MLKRLFLLIGLLVGNFGIAAPMRATTPIGIYLDCYSPGAGGFRCTAYITGGSGTYTYAWTTPLTIIGGQGTEYIIGRCPVGTTPPVSLTVTDSTGASATTATEFLCRQERPREP